METEYQIIDNEIIKVETTPIDMVEFTRLRDAKINEISRLQNMTTSLQSEVDSMNEIINQFN